MKNLRIIALFTVVMLLIANVCVFAANGRLQFYLAPHVMNDRTGEIVIDVKVKNFTDVTDGYYDEIRAVSFTFTYDKDNFIPVTADDGNLALYLDEGTLLKSPDGLSNVLNSSKGEVEFTYLNKGEKQISADGVICRFMLKAKNVNGLWNSFDRYPLRFVQGTIVALAYNSESSNVKVIDDAEGIDTSVGGYNVAPSLIPASLNKTVKFAVGSSRVDMDGLSVDTDAVSYIKDGILMVPMRYLAEGIGMKVEWQGDAMLAAAYGEYRTLRVSLYNNSIYINSAKHNSEIEPIEIDGRIYIPADTVTSLCDNAEYSFDGNEAVIYIP